MMSMVAAHFQLWLFKAMRKHTFLFIIFLYVGICIQVKATDQRGEYLVIGKDTLEMFT